ncbi:MULTISPECIES: HD domain-containing protein [unclassified Luteimonas]
MLDALRLAYATPPRAYHHFGHVEAVLAQFDAVAAGPGWARPREAWLAVLYHDAVYEAGRRDNETRSAVLAAQSIARWLPDAGLDAAHVVELIELTARHGSLRPEALGAGPAGDDRRHFLDCDMAILGADASTFDAYDRAIADEYRDAVPGWLYRLNRRRFLRGLLGRERIYLSAFFHDRLDAVARANLRRTLGVEG